LAKEYAEILRASARGHIETYADRSVALGVAYGFLVTAALIAFLLFFKRLFPRLYSAVDAWKGTRIRAIRFQSIELIREESVLALVKGAMRWIRILATVLLFYFYVPLVLGFFPWTKGVSAVLIDYVLRPVKFVGSGILAFLPNLFFLIVIALVTRYALRLIRAFFSEVGKGRFVIKGFYSEWAEPTFKIVRILVVAFAAVVAFPFIPGSESPAFRGVSIFLGVLVSLGSTSAVANIVAGVILTYMRPFHVGDRVKIADSVGDVVEKTLLVTRIRTVKNVGVTIPNSMILGSHIVNFNSSAKEHGLILNTGVTIGYDIDWRKVHELLISAARRTADILESPSPFVLQTSLNDFYVSYELNAYTEKPQIMERTYSLLHQNIQDAFNEAGVEIMSPHYGQIRDGNKTAIPDSYLPPEYVPGAIRVVSVPEGPPGKPEETRRFPTSSLIRGGTPAPGRLSAARGRRVGEEDGAVVSNASRRDGPVAGEQPFEGRGLPGAGDQPQDAPRPVDRGKGERHPPSSLVGTGDGGVRIDDLERRVAREKGSRMAVLPQPEQDEVENRRRSGNPAKNRFVAACPLVEVLFLHRHGMDVGGWDRDAIDQGFPQAGIVPFRISERRYPFIDLEQVDPVPGKVFPGESP
jgi:small-conductance mechanosensitive channel